MEKHFIQFNSFLICTYIAPVQVGQYTQLSRFAKNLTNCSELIRKTEGLLRAENISYPCSALERTDCDQTYQRIYSRHSSLLSLVEILCSDWLTMCVSSNENTVSRELRTNESSDSRLQVQPGECLHSEPELWPWLAGVQRDLLRGERLPPGLLPDGLHWCSDPGTDSGHNIPPSQ